jgi:radical SAM superfamily enzyme YgiQ (UPF0313 family)
MAQIIICAGTSVVSPMRPVGAFQIANVLRKQGYTVQVIDNWPHIAKNGTEVIKKLLSHFTTSDTLWIGFSSNWFRRLNNPNKDKSKSLNSSNNAGTVYKSIDDILTNTYIFDDEEIQDIKATVRAKSPKCQFVLGGARAPIGRLGKRPGFIDCFIEGFADTTAVEYTKYVQGKNPFLQYVKNSDGSISLTHDHKASRFDYNHDKFSWHENDMVMQGEALPMEIARGCIFNCNFCSYPLNGRKKMDYLKDPAIIRDQLEENYSKYKTTHYWFLDDTFNDSNEKLEILYNEVFSKLTFKLNFNAFMRLDLMAAHPHTVDLIAESGAGGLSFGIETLNYEANKSIGKGINRDKIVETLHHINAKMPKGSIIDSQFIIGLPYETKETARSWINEVASKDFPLDNAKIHLLAMHLFKGLDNVWTSNFEKYPEKYGYTFPNKQFPFAWVNNMGFSQKQAFDLHAEMYDQIMAKEMDGWLSYAGWLNLGMSEEEAKSRVLVNKFDRYHNGGKTDDQLRNEFTQDYIKRLLDLDPQ